MTNGLPGKPPLTTPHYIRSVFYSRVFRLMRPGRL